MADWVAWESMMQADQKAEAAHRRQVQDREKKKKFEALRAVSWILGDWLQVSFFYDSAVCVLCLRW